ncbi:hypothetical protein D3822_30225, partial [Escherichia coli]
MVATDVAARGLDISRAEIISPLAQSETVGHEAADMAAQALGLSR